MKMRGRSCKNKKGGVALGVQFNWEVLEEVFNEKMFEI